MRPLTINALVRLGRNRSSLRNRVFLHAEDRLLVIVPLSTQNVLELEKNPVSELSMYFCQRVLERRIFPVYCLLSTVYSLSSRQFFNIDAGGIQGGAEAIVEGIILFDKFLNFVYLF